jgi:hypothetical protein
MNSSSNDFKKSFVNNVAAIVNEQSIKALENAYEGLMRNTPIWSGQLISSWNISEGQPNYKVVYHPDTQNGTVRIDKPANPLNPKSFEEAISRVKDRQAKKGFNVYYIANGHKYAYGVDQGVAPYSGTAWHMIKFATDEILSSIK